MDHVDVNKCTSHYDVYSVSFFLDLEKPTESGMYEVEEANEHVNDLLNDGRYQEAEEVAQANADLIREAFEVASQTGLSPRQLVGLLQDIMVEVKNNYDPEARVIFCEPKPSCVLCTAGTTPNHLNTGLCPLHRAEKALARDASQKGG